MNSFEISIGEKIKELRLKCGLTQRELAGDKITRNMLSLIESGNASPSIPTLLYLSERLDTHIGYFFISSENDVGKYIKMSVIEDLKRHFQQKHYAECEAICQSLPQYAFDDEISYIACISNIYISIGKAYSLDIGSAYSILEKAGIYSGKSIYCGCDIKRSISYIREVYQSLTSDTIPDMLCSYEYCGKIIPAYMIMYFSTIRDLRAEKDVCYHFPKGSFHEKHVNALSKLKNGNINESQKRLRELSLDSSVPYYMQYRILEDLEDSANASGNFNLAYSSSRRKLELVKRFKF